MASILRRRIVRAHSCVRCRLLSTSPESKRQRIQSIEKILIANRGEIACRIMRTAKRLGIRTVAVYSDADKYSLHVKTADEAVRLGPPPARLSYLNASSIIDAANKTGAQAIHPGYGFLSESAEFAQLCENQGLNFIGPPAYAIREMGDKSASKRIMGAAGVPLVPGYHGEDQDIDIMKSEADKIGYPVLIKPTHGGGGKGMRIVHKPSEFADSFFGAQREAASSFGVNTILIEKYITKPRHIEVQVFGDKQGNIVHLYERDCSVQRRHQKIIEEAPAPNVSNEFRSHLGQAAVAAAKAVNYHSAGTVEFIVDTVSDQFYFMEMNTRLQVEHPVTEMIVKQDLVEWQIRIANGEPLPLCQSEVPLSGHAFEGRIYAENVPRGFLPATGVLHHYRPVQVSSSVRVETGVEQGDMVSMHYDPMIAKLVVWGEDRSAALVKMKDCLAKFQVAGLPTNIDFLQKIASHEAFRNGEVETHFIEHFKDDLLLDPNDDVSAKKAQLDADECASILAACLCAKEHTSSKEKNSGSLSLWYAYPPFRVNYSAQKEMEFEWIHEFSNINTKPVKCVVDYLPDGRYLITTGEIGPTELEIEVVPMSNNDFRVDAGGFSMNVSLVVYSKDHTEHIHIWRDSNHHQFRRKIGREDLLSNDEEAFHKPGVVSSASHPRGTVLAPMAGLVVKVLVKGGERVEEGQSIMVLEAMKMEHVVKAPIGGLVSGIRFATGQQVFDGNVLFNIKEK